MSEKIDISIVILNYNTREFLRQCLVSIDKTEKKGISVETLVVDNASSDDSVEMVEKDFPWVSLIKSSKNLGFAAGNNLAVPRSKGRYILFLNSDTILSEMIMPQVLKFMDQHPEVGALTIRLSLRNGVLDPDCHRGFPTPWASLTYFVGLEELFPKSRIFGRYHQFYLPIDKVHEIDAACGAFLFVRRKAFIEIGGWDENYFFYGEDIDLCYRLKEKGWKIIYYPETGVVHYKGASSGLRSETKSVTTADRQTRIKVAKASVEAMRIFYDKFYRKKYPSLITSIVLTGIQIKGFFRLLFNYLKG